MDYICQSNLEVTASVFLKLFSVNTGSLLCLLEGKHAVKTNM